MLYQNDPEPKHKGALTQMRQLVNKASRPWKGFSTHIDVRWLFFNNAKVSLGFQAGASAGCLNSEGQINK